MHSPFAGVLSGNWNSGFGNQGSNSNVWSRTANSSNANNAWDLNFNSSNVNPGTDNNNRNNGFAVR